MVNANFWDMDKEKKNLPNEFPPLLAFLVILLAFVCWMNIGPLVSLSLTLIPALGSDQWIGVTEFMFRHIPYILMFLALALGSRFILRTSVSELISGIGRRPDRRIFLYSYALYTLILIVFSALSYKTIRLDPAGIMEKALFILPVLICTPMQAAAEELFFRALPGRIAYHNSLPDSIARSIPMAVISGLLFTIPHLWNPEVLNSGNGAITIIYYFLWGAGAMALAVYTDGFEIPIAMHMANNIYCALIVNYENSAMPTKAIFIDKSSPSPSVLLFRAIVIYAAFFAFAWRLRKHGYFRRRSDGKEEE